MNVKELFMDAHERAVERYMEAHPDADWQDAYDATGDQAYDDMRDDLADRADNYRQMTRDAQ